MTAQPSPSQNSGYRHKPFWIYVASILLMIAPLGNLLWSLASLRIPDWYKPHVWAYWAKYVSPMTWVLLAMLFVSGVSLLVVRKWTWNLSLATLALVTLYDIIMMKQFLMMGTVAVLAMVASTLGFGLVLYFSEFRRPYMNPRLRWWETSPRYKVDLPVVLSKSDLPATLVDISRTGVLVEWTTPEQIPDIEGDVQLTLPTQKAVAAKIKRRTPKGYGLEFGELGREDRLAVRDFIDTLSEDPTKLVR